MLARIVRTTVLSLVMGLAVGGVAWALPDASDWAHTAGMLAALIATGAVVFGIGAIVTRAPELRWLLGRNSS